MGEALKQRMEQIENDKKCEVFHVNGHDLIFDDDSVDDKAVNVMDMGMKTLLNAKSVYKDTMMMELYKEWSAETGIPCEHLMIWNFTERKNKTLRTNRQIVFDLNEECKEDPNKNYTEDQIKRHLIETNENIKSIKSIYCRIGDVLPKKRSFVLLDKRKIQKLENVNQIEDGAKTVLIALKYFDLFEQKLYFIDWIMVRTISITFGDIADYIQNSLIPKTKNNRKYFQKLNGYIQSIQAMKDKKNEKIFCIYEEEAVLTNKSNRDDPVCKVKPKKYEEIVDEEFFFGDIFVFQLNPFHSYFDKVKPPKIENIAEIMKSGSNDDHNEQKLSLTIKTVRYQQEQQGIYWHYQFHDFMRAQTTMTCIEIKIRENTGWKQKWQKALIMQYKINNNIPKEQKIDKEIRKKIKKSKHKLQIEGFATFEMIRRRLGEYYNINPHHIEIWIPQKGNKWDYGSKGRGKWDQSIKELMLVSNRATHRKLC